MDNPETLEILGTQAARQRQTKMIKIINQRHLSLTWLVVVGDTKQSRLESIVVNWLLIGRTKNITQNC